MPAPPEHELADPELVVDLHLEPEPTAPGVARHALDPMERRFDPGALDAVRLLISELVTNAVRHGGRDGPDEVGVRVVIQGEYVRVEVHDTGSAGTGPTVVHSVEDEPPTDWEGGWGLGIVDALSERWGVQRDGGTRVWFELRRRGA